MGRMGVIDRLFGRGRPAAGAPSAEPEGIRWSAAGGLAVSLFAGEIVAAPAEAICTSTNPRLSLGGGTGRAVLEETGWGLKRQLEAILAEEVRRTGASELPVGFTCSTPGGRPPHRLVVHCVASDRAHRSSPEAVRRCVTGALREAAQAGCATLALPVFGAGHATLPFEVSLEAIAAALRDAAPSPLREVLIVVQQPDRLARAGEALDRVLGPGRRS